MVRNSNGGGTSEPKSKNNNKKIMINLKRIYLRL